MNFNPSVPEPYSNSWREAYRYESSDEPRLSTYQAPKGNPIPFVLGKSDFAGGQSVDTSDFPFYGFWSNNPLNEQAQEITISGFVRGEHYIANRNALIEALRIKTDDDNCGFLDLPLWGRFPVVVISYKVGEVGGRSGECDISITFKRAGVSGAKRLSSELTRIVDIESLTAKFQAAAVENFVSKISKSLDSGTLVSGFEKIKSALIAAVGRVQGAKAILNSVTAKCNMITSLVAQGVNAPRELALAMVGAVAGLVAGVAEIANAFKSYSTESELEGSAEIGAIETDSALAEFVAERNTAVVMQYFLASSEASVEVECATEEQFNTKKELENFNRTISFCSAARMFCEFDTGTYQNQQGLWKLFERLENSLDLEDADLYELVESVRIAAAETLLEKNADVELTKKINSPMPLLALSQSLGCASEKVRKLNHPYDSFLMAGEMKYV